MLAAVHSDYAKKLSYPVGHESFFETKFYFLKLLLCLLVFVFVVVFIFVFLDKLIKL